MRMGRNALWRCATINLKRKLANFPNFWRAAAVVRAIYCASFRRLLIVWLMPYLVALRGSIRVVRPFNAHVNTGITPFYDRSIKMWRLMLLWWAWNTGCTCWAGATTGVDLPGTEMSPWGLSDTPGNGARDVLLHAGKVVWCKCKLNVKTTTRQSDLRSYHWINTWAKYLESELTLNRSCFTDV